MYSDVIKTELTASRAKRKAFNAEWWTANSRTVHLRAAIRRAEAMLSELPKLREELAALESAQSALKSNIDTEDAYQRDLKERDRREKAARAIPTTPTP